MRRLPLLIVAAAALAGVIDGLDHFLAEDRARQLWQATRTEAYDFMAQLDRAHRAHATAA